jgi:hypothetical protein
VRRLTKRLYAIFRSGHFMTAQVPHIEIEEATLII